jgi:signal transduction histidine kinase
VVVAAVQALRERIKESGADIQIQNPLPSALGDFSDLQQVIQCLVGNAINYRRSNTNLSITIGTRQGPTGECLIFVSDNGIGVAKEYQESIFAPFKRLHGPEIPGAGLGLAISKHIVEAHGGRIWVESEPGCGASFVLTLRAPAWAAKRFSCPVIGIKTVVDMAFEAHRAMEPGIYANAAEAALGLRFRSGDR